VINVLDNSEMPVLAARSRYWLKLPTALVIGIVSGLLTGEAARFLNPVNPLLGIIFGMSVIALLRFQQKNCRGKAAASLVTFSVISYLAAVWVTLPISAVVGRILELENDFTDPVGAPVFTFAGYLGALIINAAVLEKENNLSGPQAVSKAASWASGGAFLGFISNELSGRVGVAVGYVVGDPPGSQMGSNDHFLALYSAYVSWQAGMLFLITLMVSRPAPLISDVTTRAQPHK
jgi:hypothetical protein